MATSHSGAPKYRTQCGSCFKNFDATEARHEGSTDYSRFYAAGAVPGCRRRDEEVAILELGGGGVPLLPFRGPGGAPSVLGDANCVGCKPPGAL